MGAEGGFAARGAAPAGGREHDLAPALAWIRSRLRHMAGDADAGDAGGRPPAALEDLARQLGLSGFERQVVLLCVAMELDTGVASLCAHAHGDAGRPYPTFALALTLFEHPTWDALAPDGPLRAWRLIEVHQRSEEPLLTSLLRIDERILHHAKGLACVDERLGPLLAPMPGGDVAEATGSPAVREVADALRRADAGRAGAFVYLLGSDPEAGRELAEGAAAASGLLLRRLSARVLEAPDAEADALARLLRRECLLAPLALYLDARELEPAAARRLSEFLGRLAGPGGGPLFVALEEVPPDAPPAALAPDVGRPAPGEQRAAWAEELGHHAGELPGRLAGQFHLGRSAIRRIARVACCGGTSDPQEFGARLWDACRRATRPRLEALAVRLEPRATWDELVLPPAELALLRLVAVRARRRSTVYDDWGFRRKLGRGLGLSVLFVGESGTGKTLAAEVLASELRLDLYRIDLSAVVSKYVGETEKNLRRLFDAAEDGGAILFFDEADALFGKRGEVKDSHDRYANIEVNYLLQRIEAYQGLAVLATNMKAALDPAFLRRLRSVVRFPFPGPAERRAIWPRAFPPGVPLGELDWDRLARFNLTGGSIQNIALDAAFLAADAGVPVAMAQVLEAARAEFRKLERPVDEADFRG
jgi:ATPase family associated with various cellular activities (AAA)